MPGLINAELRSQVGFSPEARTELVTRRDIRKYAVATNQRQQKYLDGDTNFDQAYEKIVGEYKTEEQCILSSLARKELVKELGFDKFTIRTIKTVNLTKARKNVASKL